MWANRCIDSLNSLSGADAQASVPREAQNQSSRLALDHVLRAFNDMGRPPADLSPEGALQELLGGQAWYDQVRADLAPYAKDRVSWPPVGTRPVSLVHHLPSADSHRLSHWESHLLKADAPTSHPHNPKQQNTITKPYNDPILTHDRKSYGGFIQRLAERGMIRFRLPSFGERPKLGIFFVKKKDDSLRIIFDTRILNQSFSDPPKTELPSAASFASLESHDGADVYIGSADVRNAFYGMAVPESLSDQFSLPFVRASDVGISHIHNLPIQKDSILVPCLTVLPMGWSWSLHYCQSFVANIVKDCVSADRFFVDKKPALSLDSQSDLIGTAYVDNYCVIGHDPQRVDHMLAKINKRITGLGLGVHEQSQASTQGQFVGLEFDRGRVSIKKIRLWRLKFALDRVLSFRKMSGKMLEIIIGHCTWCMLIRRESLSVFCHVYEFIRKHRDSHVFIPKSVRHELEHIRNILPLLRSDMSQTWCPLVHASDASSFGLGVCTRSASLSTVSRFGRFSERWRFLLEDKIQARRSALGGPQKYDDPDHDNSYHLSDNQLLDIDSENFVNDGTF